MRTKNLLTALGLLLTLSACVTPSIPLSADDPQNTADSSSQSSSANSSSATTGTSQAVACELAEPSSPDPLAIADNTPAFEQFNFQPQEIALTDSSITLTTAHHIFSFCETNNVWSIVSAEASEDETYDYEQALADIADPDYETIELNGEFYQYRIRLQAEWLDQQLEPETVDPDAIAPADEDIAVATEDAVFFELKRPDDTLISQQLYTLSQLQAAQLGASLGEPGIAGAASTDDALWFAATAAQGEGNSGFASLIRYSQGADEIVAEQPEEIQGDQITSMVITQPVSAAETADETASETASEAASETATETGDETASETDSDEISSAAPPALTLWLGTQRSGEGVPYYPASGLVAYQPESKALSSYTVTNSQLIGAIPHQLAANDDTLWVGTGEGTCQIKWQAIEQSDSWTCWQFTAIAQIPSEGVELFDSFLAGEPAATLKKDEVEVLWVGQQFDQDADAEADKPKMTRYEVAYETGFEVELGQGGYRIVNEAAQRAAGGNAIFWPGSQWHWGGDRFRRSLDEVALNFFGGGPRGLVSAESSSGFNLDSYTVRGEFDLLALTEDSTKVHYYSGWIDSDGIEVYPTVVPAEVPTAFKPNPLTKMAADLSTTQGP